MTESEREPDLPARFIDSLRALAKEGEEDLGALSALRKSLIDPRGMAAAACPYVVRFLPKRTDLFRERAFFAIGALFALHRGHRQGVGLGEAWHRVAFGPEGENGSMRARFVALLDCHPDDVVEHLRYAVSILRSKDVDLDWAKLLRDLLSWDREDRRVQRDWAREYWGREDNADQPSTDHASSANATEVTS